MVSWRDPNIDSPHQGVGRERVPEGNGGDETGELDWDDMLAQLGTQRPEEGWVTLQEATSATGVARSTLRSWYRSSQNPIADGGGDPRPPAVCTS